MATVGAAARSATDRLRLAGSPSPRLDAEVLVAWAAGRDRTWLAAHPEAPFPSDAQLDLARWVDRRSDGEPIAYLRGWKEWHGLRIRTDSRALIPRPETELLTDRAIDEIRGRLTDGGQLVVWEIGTGSGAVSLVLARRFRVALSLGTIRLIASDVSEGALDLAAENLEAHGVSGLVTLAMADLLEPAGSWLPRPDVVVANLPYVPRTELHAAGSLRYEPRDALDGGADGRDVLRRLLAGLPQRVAPGASVLLEVGAGQAESVLRLAGDDRASGRIHPDLAGVDRLVELRYP